MTDNATDKFPVTPATLEARARRALRRQGARLRRHKATQGYYVVRGDVATLVQLDALARELGLVADHEAIVRESV